MSHTFVVLWCLQVCLPLSLNLVKWIGTKGKEVLEREVRMMTAYFPGWGMGRLVPLQISLSLIHKTKDKTVVSKNWRSPLCFTHQHVRQPHSMLLFLGNLNPLKREKKEASQFSVFFSPFFPSLPPYPATRGFHGLFFLRVLFGG